MKYTEKEIEDYLVKNINKHFPELKFVAQQFNVDNNYIDLILKDKNTKDYYIVELKRGHINSNAIIQVLTYKKLMEINFSKNGKRRFIPLLIGLHLEESPHIYKLLEYFEPDLTQSYEKIFYRCFDLTLNGISFDFRNIGEQNFTDSHEYYTTKIEFLLEQLDYLEMERWEMIHNEK